MKFLDLIKESKFNPEVEKIQRILLNKGYFLGTTGPNRDGVDGVLGPITKTAYIELYKRPFPTKEFTQSKRKNIIIAEPPFPTKDYSVCVVFGGINYATPEWMMKQVPTEILNKKTFVFAPYTSNIKEVEAEIQNKQIKSVLGFSAGGKKVWPLCGQYEFVGLIDPSTSDAYINAYPINDQRVVMMFNNKNWGGNLEYIGKAQVKAKRLMGGNAIKVDLGHSKIPRAFFERFGNFL